jgi:transposase
VLKPLSPDAASPLSQSRAVLALLVNCYVHQIYSSKNAANLAARDPDFPWLWWEDFPDAGMLRRFRTENHAAIHQCLTATLEMLAAQKKLAGALTKLSGPQFAEEASRRITMAAFVDSVELEEE